MTKILGAAGLCLAAALLTAPAAAPAQQGPPATAPILIISIERILLESSAGRSIQTQAESVRMAFRERQEAQEAELLAEERELVDLRETLERAEFEARAAAFEDKVREMRREQRESSASVQTALQSATDELKRRLQPILIAIMNERRAGVMLDDREVVLSARALDVTTEAIQRLDQEVPSLELRVSGQP